MKSSLNLHVENTIPGVVALFGFVWLLNGAYTIPVRVRTLLANDAAAVAILLSCAYMTGVAVSLLSRLAIDWASEKRMRPLLLRRLSKSSYSELRRLVASYAKTPIWKGLPPEEPQDRKAQRAAWNAIYRHLLAEAIRQKDSEALVREVVSRRERGRLTRSLWLPAAAVLAVAFQEMLTLSGGGTLLAFFCSLVLLLIAVTPLYAYAEVTVFLECALGLRLIGGDLDLGRAQLYLALRELIKGMTAGEVQPGHFQDYHRIRADAPRILEQPVIDYLNQLLNKMVIARGDRLDREGAGSDALGWIADLGRLDDAFAGYFELDSFNLALAEAASEGGPS